MLPQSDLILLITMWMSFLQSSKKEHIKKFRGKVDDVISARNYESLDDLIVNLETELNLIKNQMTVSALNSKRILLQYIFNWYNSPFNFVPLLGVASSAFTESNNLVKVLENRSYKWAAFLADLDSTYPKQIT